MKIEKYEEIKNRCMSILKKVGKSMGLTFFKIEELKNIEHLKIEEFNN